MRLSIGTGLLLVPIIVDKVVGASLGPSLASRGLSLLAAVIVCAAVGYIYRDTGKQISNRTIAVGLGSNAAGDTLRQTAPMLAFFGAYAVYDAHRRYVGPLHFWNQSALFLLNSVALVLIATAFDLEA